MSLKRQEEIYRRLSLKYDLPIKAIKEICSAPTTFVAENMRTGDEKTIFISGFGRFGVKARRKKYIIDLKRKKDEAPTADKDGKGNSTE